jgi:5-methyltetrahydrofolate corrinoid/iron sulfur protein methyltransferase
MQIIADNLHIVNPVVAQAVARMDPGPIQDLVIRCQQAGAQAIDINSGPLPKTPDAAFAFLVETVQGCTSLPLVLDTTNPRALEAGLRVCRRPAIINGFSLEPARLERILPLAAEYDADIIGYLLGPGSQVPIALEEMLDLAVALYAAYRQAGLAPQRLIIDPVVAPVSWDNGIRHNQAVLKVMAMLPDLLGAPVRTIAGISNLASGPVPQARKIALEKAFLPMLAAAGLDMALLNVLHRPTVHTAGLCSVLLGEKVFAWEQV